MSHSQNDEESVIVRFFGDRKGRFLDIGAHDGVTLSNTRRLAELGWGGVCVEPSPSPFVALMNTYRERPDVKLVHVAIGTNDWALRPIQDSRGDFVSTFSESHRALWAASNAGRAGVPFQEIDVGCVSLDVLTLRHPGPYAFVNLDVEGINLDLFTCLQLGPLGVELVCVEYENHLAEMDRIADSQGFGRIHVTSENALYCKR